MGNSTFWYNSTFYSRDPSIKTIHFTEKHKLICIKFFYYWYIVDTIVIGSIKKPRYNDLPDIFFLLLDVPHKATTFGFFQLLQDHLFDSMLDVNRRYFLFHDFYLFLYFLLFPLFLNVFTLLIGFHIFFSYFYSFYL